MLLHVWSARHVKARLLLHVEWTVSHIVARSPFFVVQFVIVAWPHLVPVTRPVVWLTQRPTDEVALVVTWRIRVLTKKVEHQ